MKLITILLLISISLGSFFAQELAYKDIAWKLKPTYIEVDSAYKDDLEFIRTKDVIVQYYYSPKYNNNLVEYYTIHKITRVNGDDAIQANNKVYINLGGAAELIEAKARVINPDGKIVEFDESNILESEGSEDAAPHKYFAIDGVEKGADIEYTYTLLKSPNYDGRKFTLQSDLNQSNVSFSLISPENLEFQYKSYNGLPELVRDSTIEDQNIYTTEVDYMPKLESEDYSAYEKNLQHLVFKLHKNKGRASGIISFGKYSQRLFDAIYADLDKKEDKYLRKFVDVMNIDGSKSPEEKVRLLEQNIKTSIAVMEGLPHQSMPDIVRNSYCSSIDAVTLYVHALEYLSIKHELVLTTDRFENYFDEDFEHYGILENLMIYISGSGQYLTPDDTSLRLGFMDPRWANQKGLFIRSINAGGINTGVGKVKFIEPAASELSQDKMEVEVDFTSIKKPILKVKRSLSGYSAIYTQSYYYLLDEEQKKEINEGTVKFSDRDATVKEYTVTGTEKDEIGIAPLVYEGVVIETHLIEKAGDKVIFNVGEVIGMQAEMYEDKERKLNIEHGNNMIYDRTITFKIPEGYKMSGIESAKMNEVYDKEGKAAIGFVSDYKIDGNSVTITAKEYYNEMSFDKSEIEDFRRIINSAANFNKVALIFTKSE
ncbi:MAG: hypothetical protein ACI8Q1_002811 [Parvicella sp.]|jgi:hypothetical protein